MGIAGANAAIPHAIADRFYLAYGNNEVACTESRACRVVVNIGKWFGLLGLAIAFYILWQVHQLLLLVFASVVLATACNRLVQKFQRLGLRRSLAVVLTLGIVFLVAILAILLIVPPFVNQFQILLELLPKGVEQIRGWVEALVENPPPWLPDLPDLPSLTQQVEIPAGQIFQNFFSFFQNSLETLLQLLLVLVLTLMFLANPRAYRQASLQLFPSFYRRRADEILVRCESALGNWLSGILLDSLFVGALSGIGLLFLGIDLVLAHALLAGLLNFIPNIGPTLSVVFPIAIALLGPPWKILAVIVLYIVIQNIESYWLSPMIMAKQVSLLPALTLGSQIFFATSFGVLGLILALPLTVVAKVWLEEAFIKDILDRWRGQTQRLQPSSVSPLAADSIATEAKEAKSEQT